MHVRRHLPDLTIVESTRPMTHASVVDPHRREVWVDGSLPPDTANAAVLDGLTALCDHHGVPAPAAPGGRHLQLVAAPRPPRRDDGPRAAAGRA